MNQRYINNSYKILFALSTFLQLLHKYNSIVYTSSCKNQNCIAIFIIQRLKSTLNMLVPGYSSGPCDSLYDSLAARGSSQHYANDQELLALHRNDEDESDHRDDE